MISVPVPFRIKGLGADVRIILFVLCAASGLAVQYFLPFFLPLGLLLLIAPLFLLAAKPWTNKPADLGEEDWKPVGIPELDRLNDALREARRIKVPLWFRPGFGLPITLIVGFIAFAFLTIEPRIALIIIDLLLIFWPVLHFLRVRFWLPRDLELAMTAMNAALSVEIPEGLAVTPYLRLDRDAEGLRIPEDVRLMVEPKRKPEDLVGVQLQATVNKGPDGAVPYLYAVVLTHGQGPTWRIAAAMKQKGFLVESGGDAKYGTVVLRQHTENGGYHTDLADCRHLMELVIGFAQGIAAR